MAQSPDKSPKIGIAFGGGGARGFAHIGVVQALEEANINVEIIAGTSIGSLAGAAWAAGRINELAELARSITLTDLPFLFSPSWSVSGMFSGKTIFDRMEAILGSQLIEQLPKKFAAVASDLKKGEGVIMTEGSLIEAIRASSAIPGFFTPVRSKGRILVDGALFYPVPVGLAHSMGAELVIAVDLFGGLTANPTWPAPEGSGERSSVKTAIQYLQSLPNLFNKQKATEQTAEVVTVFEVLEHSLAVAQAHLTTLELKQENPTITLQPQTGGISVLDFHRGAPLIEEGYRVAIEAMPRLIEAIANYRDVGTIPN